MGTLFLVRGLPGSGKSTLASTLAEKVFSADDYFVTEGVYNFDPSKLPQAHGDCQNRAFQALASGATCAVANTFTQRWELEPYIRMAAVFGAKIFVVDLFDGGLSDEALVERNVHGVPLAGLAAMRQRYEHDWRGGNPLPPWER